MTKKQYEVLLFDADDTLFDFNRAMCESLSKALAQCGVRCSNEMIETYDTINLGYWRRYEAGKLTLPQLRNGRISDFLEKCGIDYPTDKFDENYLEQLGNCSYLFDGVKKLCEDLSRQYRLSIVTNSISSMQRKRMENSEIAGYFEQIFISGDTGFKKPEKGFFDYVFGFYKDVPHDRMLIVGDSLGADIKGGIDAGIRTCWINRRGEALDDAIQPDYELQSLEEIRKILL